MWQISKKMKMETIRVVIVDDNKKIRQGLEQLIGSTSEYFVAGSYPDCSEIIKKIEKDKPDVVLMDEPCSALDPIATAKVEELIYQLKRDYTMVIVTHNMQQAGRVSDHTAFFYLGRLIEFGSTAKIFSNPSEKQTEDYITGRFG